MAKTNKIIPPKNVPLQKGVSKLPQKPVISPKTNTNKK